MLELPGGFEHDKQGTQADAQEQGITGPQKMYQGENKEGHDDRPALAMIIELLIGQDHEKCGQGKVQIRNEGIELTAQKQANGGA